MLYPICPTCGALLSNIQLPYQRDITDLCTEYGVDVEFMSKGIVNDDEFNTKKKAIVDKYTDPDRYCCRMRLTNFCDLVRIIN
jgi:hypothetical protein